jgi:cbb3-type cytochrome oxidase subunit 3
MKEGLQNFSDTYLTSIGLIIFLAFFICMIIWVNLKENREAYKHIEKLPFSTGDNHE